MQSGSKLAKMAARRFTLRAPIGAASRATESGAPSLCFARWRGPAGFAAGARNPSPISGVLTRNIAAKAAANGLHGDGGNGGVQHDRCRSAHGPQGPGLSQAKLAQRVGIAARDQGPRRARRGLPRLNGGVERSGRRTRGVDLARAGRFSRFHIARAD